MTRIPSTSPGARRRRGRRPRRRFAVEDLGRARLPAAFCPGELPVAGALPPKAQLLESHKLAEMLGQLCAAYDLVIIDTPPPAVVSDAIPLMMLASGVLVVGRLGKTSRETAARLREQLVGLGAPTLGLIANELSVRSHGYYYGYYVPAKAASNAGRGRRDRVEDSVES